MTRGEVKLLLDEDEKRKAESKVIRVNSQRQDEACANVIADQEICGCLRRALSTTERKTLDVTSDHPPIDHLHICSPPEPFTFSAPASIS